MRLKERSWTCEKIGIGSIKSMKREYGALIGQTRLARSNDSFVIWEKISISQSRSFWLETEPRDVFSQLRFLRLEFVTMYRHLRRGSAKLCDLRNQTLRRHARFNSENVSRRLPTRRSRKNAGPKTIENRIAFLTIYK